MRPQYSRSHGASLAARRSRLRSNPVMAAASSAISFLMSLAVPSTWYFHRTARAAKLKFPSSEGARTPGQVYRIAFCPRYHRGFRLSPTLTESTDSFLAGRAVCCLRMWDQDHIWGGRLPPQVSGLQQSHSIASPATFRPTECPDGPCVVPSACAVLRPV